MNIKRMPFIIPNRFGSFIARVAAVVTVSLILVCVVGCGGGTSGTGGGGFKIAGVLRNSNGAPVSGVVVSAYDASGFMVTKVSYLVGPDSSLSGGNQGEQSVITDGQGQFGLFFENRPMRITLTFRADTFDSVLDIPNVPAVASQLNLVLKLNSESNSVEEESEQFEDEEGREIKNEVDDDLEVEDFPHGGGLRQSDDGQEVGNDDPVSDHSTGEQVAEQTDDES